MKKIVVYLGRFISMVAVVFLLRTLWIHVAELPSFHWTVAAGGMLFLNMAYWMFAIMVLFSVWQVLLRSVGISLSFADSYSIQGMAQLNKYLPGNVFHYVSRVGYAARYGIPAGITAASMGVEIVIGVFAASIVSGIGVLLSGVNAVSPIIDSARYYRAIMVITILVAGGGTILLSNADVRGWIARRKGFFRLRTIANGSLRYIFFFVTIGLFLNILIRTLWDIHPTINWFDISWRFTAAWLIGFVIPGAPGGLGVREAAMVGLFGPSLGQGVAAGLAVILRVITSVADLCTYFVAVIMKKRKEQEVGVLS